MHELSIVLGIIDIAEQTAKANNIDRIQTIELEIGALAGIQLDAFNFAWESAVKNTILSGATREINNIKGRSKCLECAVEFEVATVFDACPKCGQYFNQLLSGQELRVCSITAN